MRPYQHSLSGSNGHKNWCKDLEIHEFLDSTKYACADRRHRVVLHHVDLGTDIVRLAFPKRKDTAQIVRQHVEEDLGSAARLRDWFDSMDAERLPKPIQRRVASGHEHVAEYVSGRLPPSAHREAKKVCKFLFSPMAYLDHEPERALPLLMNSCGPMIVRKVFGAPSALPDGRFVDYGWIAEAAIFTAFDRIPDLREIIECFKSEPARQQMAAVQ